MLTLGQEARGERLLSYVVASSDMRYIEINKRDVYLQDDPNLGLVVRGEVPECGPECNVNLSQMFLEYSMSCVDCRDHKATTRHIDQFGQHLGEKLIAGLQELAPVAAGPGGVSEVFDIVLNSMGADFHKDLAVDSLQYDLARCPIHMAAEGSGLTRWIAAAHGAFVALCNEILDELAPDWKLVLPVKAETEEPLETILIARK